MDIELPLDFKEFLKLLNEKDVRYLLIGGYAVGYHGYPRATNDLDIWIAVHPENAERVVQALREFGFALPELTPDLFLQENKIVRMGNPPMRLEITTGISGVEFDECYASCIVDIFDGIEVIDPVTENGSGWCKVMPNERIVAVQIVAGNISGDAVHTVNPFDFSMVDNEGFVYVSAKCNVDGVEGLKDIQPGQKDRRWVTFIVPIGFTAASVQWNIDSFGDRILMAGLIY
ncbi:MAG: hypothetical protein NTV38_07335 [Chloroflexi bacterium]|nr:hypothetical protein [Chloroflexota bacterium]